MGDTMEDGSNNITEQVSNGSTAKQVSKIDQSDASTEVKNGGPKSTEHNTVVYEQGRGGDESEAVAVGQSTTSDGNGAINPDTSDSHDGKRLRHESSSASASEASSNTPDAPRCKAATFMFPGVAASPPRFVSLEEIMQAANGVQNMVLAHEIAVDRDFRLEKVDGPEKSLEGRIKEQMHRAFWDVLELQLNEAPPNYKQAISVLEEIKKILKSLLLPHHHKLREEIDEVLDIDLITQQAENGVIDVQRYAQYILSVMSRLCSPARDEKIRELTQTTNIVNLLKGIMQVLDLMKLDMANFTIQQVRPHIQQQSIQYERKKFTELLEVQKANGVDGLEFTSKWLKRNFDSLGLESDPESRASQQQVINRVMTSAYLEILIWDEEKQPMSEFPETLLMDHKRFMTHRDKIHQLILIGSVLLTTFAAVGTAVQGLQEFKETLKSHLLTIVSEDLSVPDKDKLESASVQVAKEVRETLEKIGLASKFDDAKEALLVKQINEIASPENRVRKVVERRMLGFIETVLASPTAAPIQIPSGLSSLQKELTSLAGQFVRLITHNRAVFGEFYADIITNFTHTLLLTSKN